MVTQKACTILIPFMIFAIYSYRSRGLSLFFLSLRIAIQPSEEIIAHMFSLKLTRFIEFQTRRGKIVILKKKKKNLIPFLSNNEN